MRPARTLIVLTLAALVGTSCIGKLAIGVTHAVEPNLILPGGTLREDIVIEGDGMMAAAIKQAMASATPLPSSAGWTMRDNSDGAELRLRASRSLPVPAAAAEATGGTFNVGAVRIESSDFVLVRTYTARITVGPLSPPTASATPRPAGTPLPGATPASLGQAGEQLAAAMMAGLSYDHYVTLPGSLQSTNGTRGDNDRVTWHIGFDAKGERELVAESLYIDWPRIALLAVLLIVGAALLVLRRRAARTTANVSAPSGL